MSQPLVVTFIKNDENLCKIYYHWSAYTEGAIHWTKDIISALSDCDVKTMTEDELILKLIRFVESHGGCITRNKEFDELDYIQKKFPNEKFHDDGSRNEGLFACSQENMNSFDSYACGMVFIDLDAHTVTNYVNSMFETYDEYAEIYDDECRLPEDKLPVYDAPINEFKFEDIDKIVKITDEIIKKEEDPVYKNLTTGDIIVFDM